jgi:hypothetical protein
MNRSKKKQVDKKEQKNHCLHMISVDHMGMEPKQNFCITIQTITQHDPFLYIRLQNVL